MRRPPWWLLALLVLLAFAFQGTRGIWEPDEGRYTAAGLNMLERGDWLVPTHRRRAPAPDQAADHLLGDRHQRRAVRPQRVGRAAARRTRLHRHRAAGVRPRPTPVRGEALAAGPRLVAVARADVCGEHRLDRRAADVLRDGGDVRVRRGVGSRRHRSPPLAARDVARLGTRFHDQGPARPAAARRDGGVPGDPRPAEAARPVPARGSGAVCGRRLHLVRGHRLAAAGSPRLFPRLRGLRPRLHRRAQAQCRVVRRLRGSTCRCCSSGRCRGGCWRSPQRAGRAPRGTAARAGSRSRDLRVLLLLYWFLLPLAVFFLARSRLELYVLPLFVPLALLVARPLAGWPWLDGRRTAWIAGSTALLLLALKGAVAYYPADRDARVMAEQLRPVVQRLDIEEIAFVGMRPFYGLTLYLDTQVEGVHFGAAASSIRSYLAAETLCDELADSRAQPVRGEAQPRGAVPRCGGALQRTEGRTRSAGSRAMATNWCCTRSGPVPRPAVSLKRQRRPAGAVAMSQASRALAAVAMLLGVTAAAIGARISTCPAPPPTSSASSPPSRSASSRPRSVAPRPRATSRSRPTLRSPGRPPYRVKLRRAEPGAEDFNNRPRYDLAAYELQKLFLEPAEYVVPPTALRFVPARRTAAVRRRGAAHVPRLGRGAGGAAVLAAGSEARRRPVRRGAVRRRRRLRTPRRPAERAHLADRARRLQPRQFPDLQGGAGPARVLGRQRRRVRLQRERP